MSDAVDPNADLDVKDEAQIENPNKKRNKRFKSGIESCKSLRKKYIVNWNQSIDLRRGKPFSSQSDADRIVVPSDWIMTKSKQAALYSQTPQVRVNHHPQTLAAGPWLSAYEQRLNDTLAVAGIETAMDECLPDCINAAGIGVVLVAHEAIEDMVEVPAIDLSLYPPEEATRIEQTKMMPDGSPLEMEEVPRTIDHRYLISRISPADYLWDTTFTGSDFDNANWVGRTGRISWARAVNIFKLTEEDRSKVVGDDRTTTEKLTYDSEKDAKYLDDDIVSFDEIFYKEYQYDPEAKSYFTIHHVVFVNGKDDPVIDEPWKGQRMEEQSGQLIGALKFPIRALTLSYISDEAIPPSDSAMGRPQVEEINKARTQMIMQRERSLPVRWVDINRVDPTILGTLMRGVWQPFIPVQGQGTNVIGEVSRASMPQENFMFDKIAKEDLNQVWTAGPNQEGTGTGVETAEEARALQANFTARIGRERAKVAKFFVSIAEVLGGLLALYEPPESFGEGFDPAVSRTLAYSILADSTVLIDSNQKIKRLVDFTNFSAKSGWLDVPSVLREIASLSGLDPNVVIKPPQPNPPEMPNISLRLTGTEDLMNPMAVAMLLHTGQMAPIELIEQAKQYIQVAVTPPTPGPQGGGMVPPGGPVAGPEELPSQSQPPPAPPLPPVPEVGDANPDWEAMSRINTRSADGNQ